MWWSIAEAPTTMSIRKDPRCSSLLSSGSASQGRGELASLFSVHLHVLFQDVDVIYFLDPPMLLLLILRFFGKKVVLHTDGLGWKRRKWGPMARGITNLLNGFAHAPRMRSLPITRHEGLLFKGIPNGLRLHPIRAANPAGRDHSVFNELV